ncbi:MAG: hypothetical protein ABJB01_00610 [Rudaea sp.]
MRAFLILTAIVLGLSQAACAVDAGTELPARFIANRLFLVPQTDAGKIVDFYVDSAGGTNMICRSTAEQLHLKMTPFNNPEFESELGKNLAKAAMPTFKAGAGIPSNAIGDKTLLVHDCRKESGSPVDAAGFLSSRWLAGRVWTWDYPAEKFRVEANDFRPAVGAQKILIAFKTDSKGKRVFDMIRFPIRVDGQTIDMLLDTGATTTLTADALKTIGDKLPAERATSFIAESIFNRWHTAHPEWHTIEHAEERTNASMIEVPEIEIAGSHVGPVWFTLRRDTDFHDFMSAVTDRQIEGAIGGDAFYHFVMTIDYPNAVAYFRCVKDCKAK